MSSPSNSGTNPIQRPQATCYVIQSGPDFLWGAFSTDVATNNLLRTQLLTKQRRTFPTRASVPLGRSIEGLVYQFSQSVAELVPAGDFHRTTGHWVEGRLHIITDYSTTSIPAEDVQEDRLVIEATRFISGPSLFSSIVQITRESEYARIGRRSHQRRQIQAAIRTSMDLLQEGESVLREEESVEAEGAEIPVEEE